MSPPTSTNPPVAPAKLHHSAENRTSPAQATVALPRCTCLGRYVILQFPCICHCPRVRGPGLGGWGSGPYTRGMVTPRPGDDAGLHVNSAVIAQAASVLRAGGLVVFPTETVYGVARVFAVKGRPADNPLIVHLADQDGLEAVAARVPPLAWKLAARFWPGPLTLVIDAAPEVPAVTTGGLRTVAVRMPDHPLALALLGAAGVPVAAPSANRSGRPSPTTAAHAIEDLDGNVDMVLDGGPCALGVESTVIDARGDRPVVLREGAVTREQLGLDPAMNGRADVSKANLTETNLTETNLAASPGTRHRHYAPRCRVEIAAMGQGPAQAQALARGGLRVGLVAPHDAGPSVQQLASFRDAEELARLLYSALRAAEGAGVDVVVIEAVEPIGIGRAVMDRVKRAAD
jgi:L-threonylcarbamoyladenylate synthase